MVLIRAGAEALFWPLLAAAILAGCESGSTGWTIVEDKTTAGVTHVVNTPPPTGIAPTWTIEPDLRIGAVEADGPDNFGTIKGIAVDDQGRIAVLDAQAQEVRLFGTDGKHLRTFGRKGGGPGEFGDANGLVFDRDGLIRVHDPSNRRLSLFHVDNGFVNAYPLDIQSLAWVWGAVLDTAGQIFEQSAMRVGTERRSVLKGYDAEARWTDTILIAIAAPNQVPRGMYSYTRGTTRGITAVPFWPSAARTMDPRHAFWTRPGDKNEYVIIRTTFTGDTTLVFESRRAAAPVTPAERDSSIAALRKLTESELDWSQIPETKPIVTQLFVADQRDVWVRVTTADSLTAYDVFGDDGHYKGTATLAARPIPFLQPIVRGDRFYAVITDELDVQYVVRGRLVKVPR